MIELYTDGSCKGNPGPGGWAVTILKKGSSKPFAILHGNVTQTTNNRMEMTAVVEALRYIHASGLVGEKFLLHSDSNLIVQTINQGWKRKKNTDIWSQLDKLLKGLDVKFIWVKGHADNHWNIETDKLALSEAEKAAAHPARSGRTEPAPGQDEERQPKLF